MPDDRGAGRAAKKDGFEPTEDQLSGISGGNKFVDEKTCAVYKQTRERGDYLCDGFSCGIVK